MYVCLFLVKKKTVLNGWLGTGYKNSFQLTYEVSNVIRTKLYLFWNVLGIGTGVCGGVRE